MLHQTTIAQAPLRSIVPPEPGPGALAIITRWTSIAAAAFAIVGGIVSLTGWLTNRLPLADWSGSHTPIPVNAALCGMIAGLALFVSAIIHTVPTPVRILSGLVAMICALSLVEHFTGKSLLSDALLPHADPDSAFKAAAAKMSMASSTSFALIAAATMMATGTPRSRRMASMMSVVALCVSTLALLGCLYGANKITGGEHVSFDSGGAFTGIPFPSAAILAALAIGTLLSIPEHGVISALRRDDAGGVMLRRLVLPIVFVPVAAGWFEMRVSGLLGPGIGLAMLIMLLVAVLLSLLWWTARGISRMAQIAHDNLRALQQSEDRHRTLAANLPGGAAFVVDSDMKYMLADGEALRELGSTPEDFEGKTVREALPSNLADEYEPLFRQALAGKRFKSEHRAQGRHFVMSGGPLRLENGQVYGALAVSYDITERKRAEEELRLNRELVETVVRQMDVGAGLLRGSDLRFLLINEAYQAISPAREILGRTVEEAWPEMQPAFADRCRHVVETGDSYEAEDELFMLRRSPEGALEQTYLTWSMHRVRLPGEAGWGILLSAWETTNRKQIEEALRESEERFRQLADAMPQMVWTARPDGYRDYFNERWYEFTGLNPGIETDPSWEPLLHPDDVQASYDRWYRALRSGEPYEIEHRFKDRHLGGYRWFLGRAFPVTDSNGTIIKWYGTCTDIDRQKRAEEEVGQLNRRLQRAMQETHHRVKNNLQVISAMVDLQIMEDTGTVPVDELKRLNQHIQALAAIHDVLTHQAKSDAGLEFMSAREGIGSVAKMLTPTTQDRKLNVELEEVIVPLRQGASLAILVNELVANSLKHGRGEVCISLRHVDNRAELTVSDHGPGFPEGFNPAKAANTGLDLVENVARWDLNGAISYQNRKGGGASVLITFPIETEAFVSDFARAQSVSGRRFESSD